MNGMETQKGSYRRAREMNRNQLIRIREIFAPFFRVFSDYCVSYAVYNCIIEAEERKNEKGEDTFIICFTFDVSGENGVTVKRDILYSVEKDEVYYNPKEFVFEKGHYDDLEKAIRDVIKGFNSIDIPFNKMIVEEGTRWVYGMIGKGCNEKGEEYSDYVIFVKSEKVFGSYALPKYDSEVELY